MRKTYDVSAASTPLASISLHCTRFQEHCNNNKKTNAIRTIAHDSVVVSFCSSSKPKCCGEWTGSVPCHGQCPQARMCALSVIIGTPSEEGNNRDCGTLVRLNNVGFYELTPRHVVLASPATLGPVNDDMMGSKG